MSARDQNTLSPSSQLRMPLVAVRDSEEEDVYGQGNNDLFIMNEKQSAANERNS